jgi:hypothetical protein
MKEKLPPYERHFIGARPAPKMAIKINTALEHAENGTGFSTRSDVNVAIDYLRKEVQAAEPFSYVPVSSQLTATCSGKRYIPSGKEVEKIKKLKAAGRLDKLFRIKANQLKALVQLERNMRKKTPQISRKEYL